MIITLKKFGTTLTSRQAGKEAYAAFKPSLAEVKSNSPISINFEGVVTFSPSWGDEFLTPLHTEFKERLTLENTENPSVRTSIELLEDIHKISFNRV